MELGGEGTVNPQIHLLLLTSDSPGPRKSSGSQLISFTSSVPPVFLLTISTFDALHPFTATTPVIQHSFALASASSSIDALWSTEMVALGIVCLCVGLYPASLHFLTSFDNFSTLLFS